jgi:hypothetical protein
MTASNWVQIITTLFLGATALFVPYLSEKLKRKWFAPKLSIEFKLVPPYCHQTFHAPINSKTQTPVYYFRFQIVNTGQTQAKLCEAVLEKIWQYDSAERPTELEGYSPINLRWSGKDRTNATFLNINPNRKVFCDIGHIFPFEYQYDHERQSLIDIPGKHDPKALRFVLDQTQYPYSQLNCFIPGKYGMKIVLYSENAEPQEVCFRLSWSGSWQDTESVMFKELVIQKVKHI